MMILFALSLIALLISLTVLVFVVGGNAITLKRLGTTKNPEKNSQPLSIIKPIKGLDPSFEKNLHSHYAQKYPAFEMILCFENRYCVEYRVAYRIAQKYPHIPTKFCFLDCDPDRNPKVQLLEEGIGWAKHEWLLTIDGNVHLPQGYFQTAANAISPDLGVATTPVKGSETQSLGADLEKTYLTTVNNRALITASEFGIPYVLGKAVMVSKTFLKRIGGVKVFSPYIAEDYMTGMAAKLLGLKVRVLPQLISQPLHKFSFKAHWKRQLRWATIRKKQTPLVFLLESLQNAIVGSTLLGLGLWGLLPELPLTLPLIGYWVLWMGSDEFLDRQMSGEYDTRFPLFWLLHQGLQLARWTAVLFIHQVDWRDRRFALKAGGMIEPAPPKPATPPQRLPMPSPGPLKPAAIPR